jgi:hypothetical protein
MLTLDQMAAWEFQTLQNIADQNGWHKFISMQNYYNLIYREEEREMVRSGSSPSPDTVALTFSSLDPLLQRHRRGPHPLVPNCPRCAHTPVV